MTVDPLRYKAGKSVLFFKGFFDFKMKQKIPYLQYFKLKRWLLKEKYGTLSLYICKLEGHCNQDEQRGANPNI